MEEKSPKLEAGDRSFSPDSATCCLQAGIKPFRKAVAICVDSMLDPERKLGTSLGRARGIAKGPEIS